MQAITIKYLGPTDTRGTRLKVQAMGMPARYYPYDHAERDGGRKKAAIDYIKRHDIGIYHNWHCGMVDSVTHVYVSTFTDNKATITHADYWAWGLIGGSHD
jgi:hypothetical protein